MLQPIAVLREAGVNWWWLCVQNSRFSDTLLDYYYVKRHYYTWIDRLIPIADAHGTGSPEWRAEVDATAPKLHDEAIAREAAALVAKTFDLWKAKLPPGPEAGRTENG